MKLTSSELEIGNLYWISVFCLLVALFLGLMGMLSDWDVVMPVFTLLVGYSIGLLASKILKAQDVRISELEKRIDVNNSL